MKALIGWFAERELLGWLMTFMVIILGIFSYISIKRETFPNVSYDVIAVTTIFPGAAASEVEKLITNPLELQLKEVTGIKQMNSVSTEGRSMISLMLDVDQTTLEKAKNDVESAVDSYTDRPLDAKEPVVLAVESKLAPVIGLTLYGDVSDMRLRTSAKFLEKQLRDVPGLAKVNYDGLRDIEYLVEANPAKLSRYQITLEELVGALKRQNLSIPGGTIEGDLSGKKEIAIRTSGQYDTPEDIAETVIRANDIGESVKVSDVATVSELLERPKLLVRANGKESIVLRVLQKENADAIDLVAAIKEKVEEVKRSKDARWDPKINVGYIDDYSFFIKRRLSVLQGNLAQGLILVLLIVGLLMPWRTALLTAGGIPFAFLGTMIVFYYTGVTLNLISVMGLIIVCGMLVDDAIVVGENATQMVEKGMSPNEAAARGAQEIWMPVAASVMTTVGAFYPMLNLSGIFGKFIKYIPMGVITALLFSLVECYFIMPAHLRWIYRGRGDAAAIASGAGEPIYSYFNRLWQSYAVPFYVGILESCIRYRYLVLVFFFLLIAASGILVKTQMRIVLFPTDGIEVIVLNFEAPVGTKLERTQTLMNPVEKIVAELPKDELLDYVSKAGMQGLNMFDPETFRGSHYGQMLVYLSPETDRTRSASEIKDELRKKIGNPQEIKFKFGNVATGPPTGSPINIGVRGENYEDIIKVVNQIKGIVEKLPGAFDIVDTYTKGKEEINVSVDPVNANSAQLTIGGIGATVRAAYEGIVATSIRNLEEEIDVRVTLPAENRSEESSLERLYINNNRGNLVPLSRVARFGKSQGIESYLHENNQRQVTVKGNIDDRVSSTLKIHGEVKKLLPEILKANPGVGVYFGGEEKDTNESLEGLKIAMLIAIVGIYFMLILSFNSIFQPMFILLSIPMGIVSVIWAFFLHNNKPLSFLCMIGVVALSGVIVNNIIVLMDTINEYRRNGMKNYDSIIAAARSRFRPIFLTTATTVFGLLPTAYGWGGLDPFVVPIALSLGWGLGIGSILTILMIPCFIAIKDDVAAKF